jgi:DNA-3-methyladenine glycosylase II
LPVVPELKRNPAATRRGLAHLRRDPVMASIMQAVGPCRLRSESAHSPFASLARAIAYQQLNGTAAGRIFGRFVALYAPAPFPPPEAVLRTADEVLRGVGFSYAKVRALRDLAEKTLSGTVPESKELQPLADEAIIERLTQVRGVGPWTVQMLLMFQLGRPDVFPADDFALQYGFQRAYGLRGMPTRAALAKFAERWRPHRTMAAWYLWRAVELARAGKLPKPVRRPRVAQQKRRTPRRPARKLTKRAASRGRARK